MVMDNYSLIEEDVFGWDVCYSMSINLLDNHQRSIHPSIPVSLLLKPDSPQPLLSSSPSRMEVTVASRFSSTFPNLFPSPIALLLHFTPKMTLPLIQQNFLSCNTLHHTNFTFMYIALAPNFTFCAIHHTSQISLSYVSHKSENEVFAK
jgi:hypothetical protein